MDELVNPISFDLPTDQGDPNVWGTKNNAALAALRDGLNTVIALLGTMGASGFVFYDPVNGWPNTPTSNQYVFVSIGSPSAPQPTGGALNSVWMYQIQ